MTCVCPVTDFSLCRFSPACFQVILARSAMTQVHLHTYDSEHEKKALEQAIFKFKGDAIQALQNLSNEYNKSMDKTTKDNLLASIMSLGNLDRRAGSSESANMHYAAIRGILKSTGGPLAVGDPALRRVSLFFECMYGTNPQSYVYDASDFSNLLEGFNKLLAMAFAISSSHVRSDEETVDDDGFYIGTDTKLYGMLSKTPPDLFSIAQQYQLELVWQLTCALLLAAIVVDKREHPLQLRQYIRTIVSTVQEGPPKLTVRDSCTNVMWLLFQGMTHSSEQSWSSSDEQEHSRRILRVVGWMFVCKYLNFGMRLKVKTWVLRFLSQPEGRANQLVLQPLQLELFDFSYAS